jgi:hypothetical protein
MTRRVAIGVHEITRVLAGEQTIFLRPHSNFFTRVAEGDRLWIAEPFYLEKRFDGLAPSVARKRGAVPAFAADNVYNAPALARTHGQRQPARSLCREWHRAHLVITSRTELLLQDLADDDIAQFGFRTRSAFAAHWDQQAALAGVVRFKVASNPRVLRFGFDLVREPIAFAPRPEPKQPSHKPRAALPPVPAAPAVVARQPTVLAVPVAPPPPPPAPPATAPITPMIGHLKSGATFPVKAAADRARGDKAFLAQLLRERPSGHAAAASGPTVPRRQAMPQVLSANGTCPTCGTRLAFGCEHHPASSGAATGHHHEETVP